MSSPCMSRRSDRASVPPKPPMPLRLARLKLVLRASAEPATLSGDAKRVRDGWYSPGSPVGSPSPRRVEPLLKAATAAALDRGVRGLVLYAPGPGVSPWDRRAAVAFARLRACAARSLGVAPRADREPAAPRADWMRGVVVAGMLVCAMMCAGARRGPRALLQINLD